MLHNAATPPPLPMKYGNIGRAVSDHYLQVIFIKVIYCMMKPVNGNGSYEKALRPSHHCFGTQGKISYTSRGYSISLHKPELLFPPRNSTAKQ